ncbi:thiamine pyrophosphate-dependent dehydrogenase E1 component subunit alpha [Psittacicella hinzii]|uniref:Pyruvate dehydrogenase E1 component subunit alpha n=1 Tax=Psittacicella hinzii TaxID=2028575 RepID=A0A3A1YRJ0_9GAMM|nr:thiamine pyrophosphate-dependent dehydrogenase E1 component subunit alpha [Psittacicella hinzii]RIY40812.1 ABC transporter substrate-binding protein [Psittacicella hinzii]
MSSLHLPKDKLLAVYRKMRTIREFEDRLHLDFARGEIPGFVHLYAGEEAVAVGVCEHLQDEDRIASTHRGHGHCIAKGVDVIGMMKEIYGRYDGVCHGKGGSMHIADLSKGMMGANGILGAGAPLVCGAALAAKIRKNGAVAVTFCGDGAANQGTVLESLNLAAIWQLPVIFVIENNGYAESTSRCYATAVEDYVKRAEGFAVPAVSVDGNDFFAVHQAVGQMIEAARAGKGPALIECRTNRFYGHFEGDAQTYRAPGEVEKLRAEHDCLQHFAQKVIAEGLVSEQELATVDQEVKDLIASSVEQAKAAPQPAVSELLTDVYVNY